jgi:hypothetical protein
MRDILILNEAGEQGNIFWQEFCLVEIFYLSVISLNYKQHILSPVKVSFLSLSQHADK